MSCLSRTVSAVLRSIIFRLKNADHISVEFLAIRDTTTCKMGKTLLQFDTANGIVLLPWYEKF